MNDDEATNDDEPEGRDHKETITDDVTTSLPDWLLSAIVDMDAIEALDKRPTASVSETEVHVTPSELTEKLIEQIDATATTEAVRITSGFPQAIPVVTWDTWSSYTAEAKAEINELGHRWKKSFYEDIANEGLVFLVADPFDKTPTIIQQGALAEMDRRHIEAMQESSRTAHWAAFMVYVLALVQVVFLAERLFNG